MKILLLLLIVVSCEKIPAKEVSFVNGIHKVEMLFKHKGCSVYRFQDDGHTKYYTDCGGATQWRESCGKNCSRTVGVN